MARGGFRPGAGRPPGKTGPQQKTIEKALLREQARALIAPHLATLIAAQVANAGGLKYLVTRDKKNGKFIRVGEAMAKKDGEETIEVWEKDPSVQAFTDLLNRLIDKPTEHVDMVVTDDEERLKRLDRGRARNAAR